ncbi:hypothetical protein H4582DRAFT_1982929, partial [Lactarius indigo]
RAVTPFDITLPIILPAVLQVSATSYAQCLMTMHLRSGTRDIFGSYSLRVDAETACFCFCSGNTSKLDVLP